MAVTEKVNVLITGKDKSKGAFDSASRSATGLSKKLGTMAAVAIPAVVVGLGTKAVQAAMQFETAMGNINTLMNDNGEAVEKLETGIKEMMKTVPKSAEELGKSAYSIVSAGISDTAQALDVLESSAKLAVGGLGTTEEATDILTSAINAFGIDAMKSKDVANTFFLAVKSGKTTVSELAQGFGQVAPLANEMGIQFNDLLSATSAMTTSGTKASAAYTGIKAALSNMIKPTEDMKEAYKELGIGVDDVKTKLSEDGLISTLHMLSDAVEGDTEKMAGMFGSVEGLNAVMMLLGETGENANEIFKAMGEEMGALDIAYEKQKETTEALWQVTKNKFQVVMFALGNAILPALNTALGWVGDKFVVLTEMMENIKSPGEALKSLLDKITGSSENTAIMVIFLKDEFQKIWDTVTLLLIPALEMLKQVYIDNQETLDKVWVGMKKVYVFLQSTFIVGFRTLGQVLVTLLAGLTAIGTFLSIGFMQYLDVVTVAVDKLAEAFRWLGEKAKAAWEWAQKVNPFGGSSQGFQSGGIVNAPLGQAVPAMVHGGERIIPSWQNRGGSGSGSVTVNINGGTYLSETVAEEMGNYIIDQLKLQMRI